MSSTNERTAADVRAYTTSTTVAPTALKPRPPLKKGRKVRHGHGPLGLGHAQEVHGLDPGLRHRPLRMLGVGVARATAVRGPVKARQSSPIVDGAREARPAVRHAFGSSPVHHPLIDLTSFCSGPSRLPSPPASTPAFAAVIAFTFDALSIHLLRCHRCYTPRADDCLPVALLHTLCVVRTSVHGFTRTCKSCVNGTRVPTLL